MKGSNMLTGGCLCGGVRYMIDRPLGTMCHCHCSNCRRAGGASFATGAVITRAAFSVVSGHDLIANFESSKGFRRHFCSRCGSQLYASIENAPQILTLRCGTLDGDPQVRPSFHIHCGTRAPWVEISDDLEKFDDAVHPEHVQRLYFRDL